MQRRPAAITETAHVPIALGGAGMIWLARLAWLSALWLAVPAWAQTSPKAPRTWTYRTLKFVAIQDDRLQTIDLRNPDQPRLTDERQMAGYIADVTVKGGLVVVTVLAPQQQVLIVTDSGLVAELGLPPLPADATQVALALAKVHEEVQLGGVSAKVGRVVSVLHGEAEVAIDGGVPIAEWQALAVRPTAVPATGGLVAPVVGIVTRVRGRQVTLELPRGAGIEVGDAVERTNFPPERHRFMPLRGQYETWQSVYLRPIMPIGAVGIGLGFEVGATNGAIDLLLRGNPITLQPDAIGATRIDASVLFNGDYFAAGVGAGVAKIIDGFCRFHFDFRRAGPQLGQPPVCEEWTWIGSTDVRFGSLDGVHLALGLGMGPSKLRRVFLQHDGRLVVPVSRTFDARMAWTAREDYGHFEVGGRMFLRGIGDRESLSLTFGIGGVEIDTPQEQLEGPAATIGLEWRK